MALTISLIETNKFIRNIFKIYTNCLVSFVRDFSNYFSTNAKGSLDRKETTQNENSNSLTYLNENRAGLPHLEAICQLIEKPIEVYDEDGKLKFTLGDDKYKEKSIKLQYHKRSKHYTLLKKIEPFTSAGDGMCLYNCISDYTKTDPNILKSCTLDFLKSGNDIDRYKGLDLCWGGASYTGSGPTDAAWYLDNCQGKQGHKFPARAHPRSHASNPNGVGVESYSYEGRKTGFESYQDQDFVAHYALQSRKTRENMDALNEGELRRVVHISRQELGLPRPVQGGTWIQGTRTESFDVATVTLVIQHYQGEYNNPEAPVFLQTMYPRYP